jgi:hypothetical protein
MAKGPFGGIGSFVRKNHSLPIVGSLQLPLQVWWRKNGANAASSDLPRLEICDFGQIIDRNKRSREVVVSKVGAARDQYRNLGS